MSENTVTPAYREEKLLANIAGEDYEITPATRKEKLLAEIQGFVSEIQGLPDTTGAQEGDVLVIGSGGPEWAEAPEGLPDTTGAEVGDVLTIGNDGPEWAAPGGGGLTVTVEFAVNTLRLNRTASTIMAAMQAGIVPVCTEQSVIGETVTNLCYIISSCSSGENGYEFTAGGQQFAAAGADDYPTIV